MNELTGTLVEKISGELLQMIHDRDYQSGDRLPTEKELCVQLHAGRNTVREALKVLASRNIVVIRQGAGCFMSDKQGVMEDPLGFGLVNDRTKLTLDLLQVRLIIEPPIAALAAQCATEEDIAQLKPILEKMELAISRKSDYVALDAAFHEKIAQCTHNIVMENLIPVITKGVSVFAHEVVNTEYDQTLRSHRQIFTCISNRQAFEAEMAMRFHLLYNNNRYTASSGMII